MKPLREDDLSHENQSKAAATDLEDVIARVEEDDTPTAAHDIARTFRELKAGFEEAPEEVVAEELAFTFHSHDQREASVWGLYFGPFLSGKSEAGEAWESPALGSITPSVLRYWAERAQRSTRAVLRARYADLCWEMPKALDGVNSDHRMARQAIDAYLKAVEENAYRFKTQAIGKLLRALSLSLELGDRDRIETVRDALIALELSVAEDGALGLWGFAFDALVEPPRKQIPVSDEQRNRLVQELEERLSRLQDADPRLHEPSGVKAAALRLARYYRRRGSTNDVKRVLRSYRDVVVNMEGHAAPLIVGHCLEELHEHLRSFGLHADAKGLNQHIRQAGEQSLVEMKELSVEVEIPTEQVESFFERLLDGEAQQVLERIAVHFIPRKGELRTQLLEVAKESPLSYLFSTAIIDAEGRTVAHVGPIDSDLDGQLLRHIAQALHLWTPWLRSAFERATQQGTITEKSVLAFLSGAPAFDTGRFVILETGVKRYFSEDTIAAVHILAPQVEQGVRHLAALLGLPTLTARRGGGFYERTLDDLLRDTGLEPVLGADVLTYLRVLLTDPRGWNVRNTVCHGLAPVSTFSLPVADRLIHAALVLALVRKSEDDSEDEAGSVHPTERTSDN